MFTLPVLVISFGSFSTVSFFTNLLVLPVLPLLLGLGFLFLLGGAVVPFTAALLSLPVFFLLKYLVVVIESVSRLPFVAVHNEVAAWGILFFIYAILGILFWNKRQNNDILLQ